MAKSEVATTRGDDARVSPSHALTGSRGTPPAKPNPPSSRLRWLVIAAVVSLVLSLVPYGNYALYPFKLFTTWVHECGHATMALLVGGSVQSVTIASDTSGLTTSMVPSSTWARVLVSSAGYNGAALFGCFLLAATRWRKAANWLVWGMGALMLVSLVFWIRNGFGALVVLGLGGAFVAMGRFAKGEWARFIVSFLALQVALNALYDIRVLFSLEDFVHSDAKSVSKLLFLPAGFWAALWLVFAVVSTGLTLYWTRERSDSGLSTGYTKSNKKLLVKKPTGLRAASTEADNAGI